MAQLDLTDFERQILIRPLQREDFDRIVELQRICFPGMTTWTEEEYFSQVDHFAEGQICVEYEGKVVASSSSLILDFDIYGEEHSFEEITANSKITNHNPEGDTLYGIDIIVHPKFRGRKLARRIYDARKDLVRNLNLKRIVIGGRIPGYHRYKKDISSREYVQQVINRAIHDPVLTTQLSNGFVIKRIIDSYLQEDIQSAGYGILMEWNNFDYKPAVTKYTRVCVQFVSVRFSTKCVP